MPSLCFYFQAHQPYRLKRFRVFDIGHDPHYFNDDGESDLNNKKVLQKVAGKAYLPTNEILLELLKCYKDFRVSFSFSGILLEQLEEVSPETLYTFQKLVDTGRVEVLSETYYHSLSFFHSRDEFERQVLLHKEKIRKLFGVRPKVFRNTELSYRNDLAQWAEENGYKGIVAEGWDPVLSWRSPNFVYKPVGTRRIKLLLKNYRLSDDIAFRFSSHDWEGYPLTAGKFGQWFSQVNGNGDTVNLFMDYETFGEHQWEETGIFNFLRHLPGEILQHPDNGFKTPSEVIENYPVMGEIDMPHIVSWADTERDLTAWMGNAMQHSAISSLYELEEKVLKSRDSALIEAWRRLQISDHFYYMCTKWFADGDVHSYFNPYESPYDAYISFSNALQDLRLRLEQKEKKPHVPS